MPRDIKSPWLRYALAILLFAGILGISILLRYFSFQLNLTILIVAGLVAASWFGGRGPGILLTVLLMGASIARNPIAPDASIARVAFGHFSVSLLLIFLVILISGRKKAETSLREQRELLQVTLSSIGDAVIATDVKGTISFINPKAETLTGWTRADATGKPLSEVFEILDEVSREPIETSMRTVERNRALADSPSQMILVTKEGDEIPVENSTAPIKDPDGNVVGAVIVFHDVSERRKREQEREELLARETSARSEAETANRLKDEFLATVSHELRTPLNAIMGWAGMMRQGNPDPETVQKALEVIERNAKTQNEIIGDILDVSRIVTGKLRIESIPVDLIPIIRGTVETLYPAAAAKSIAVNTAFGNAGTTIIGDSERLQQVFWNLLSNAIKFTPKNGEINISLLQANSHIEVSFRDSGIGIQQQFLPHVFERFRQIDSSSKRVHGGLGLGLAIVRHIVEAHGGNVTAASEGAGKGATFSVQFPVSRLREAAASADNNINLRPDLDGLRVLVVDDDAEALEMICMMIEECGAQTRSAESSPAAIVEFDAWRPDVIVSDLGMPHEDGFDLISKIRLRTPNMGGNVPAAALTAYVSEKDRDAALAAGFQMHIPKPVDPDTLVSAVAELAKFKVKAKG